MIIIPTGTDAPIYHWPLRDGGPDRPERRGLPRRPPPAERHPPRRGRRGGGGRRLELRPLRPDARATACTRSSGSRTTSSTTGSSTWPATCSSCGPSASWSRASSGRWKYLATYLAIGTLHGAFVQTLLLRSGLDGHAAGASAVVFGLLAICMVWAPRNELNCVVILTDRLPHPRVPLGPVLHDRRAALHRRAGRLAGPLGARRRRPRRSRRWATSPARSGGRCSPSSCSRPAGSIARAGTCSRWRPSGGSWPGTGRSAASRSTGKNENLKQERQEAVAPRPEAEAEPERARGRRRSAASGS